MYNDYTNFLRTQCSSAPSDIPDKHSDYTPMIVQSEGILPCKFKTIHLVDASDLLNALQERFLFKEAEEVEEWIDRHSLGHALLRLHASSPVSTSTFQAVEQLIGTAYINVDWI